MHVYDRQTLSRSVVGKKKVLLFFRQRLCTECTHQKYTIKNLLDDLERQGDLGPMAGCHIHILDVDNCPSLVKQYGVVRVPTLIRIDPVTLEATSVKRERQTANDIKVMMQ